MRVEFHQFLQFLRVVAVAKAGDVGEVYQAGVEVGGLRGEGDGGG